MRSLKRNEKEVGGSWKETERKLEGSYRGSREELKENFQEVDGKLLWELEANPLDGNSYGVGGVLNPSSKLHIRIELPHRAAVYTYVYMYIDS